MSTPELRRNFETIKLDLSVVENSPNFIRIKNTSFLMEPWSESKNTALKWLAKVEPFLGSLEDADLQNLNLFATNVVDIADGRGLRQGEAIPDAIRRARADFQSSLPLLAYVILEASGILSLSKDNLFGWKQEVLGEVHSSAKNAKAEVETLITNADDNLNALVADADKNLKAAAVEAGKDFELAKERASRISVDIARDQFNAASKGLRTKSIVWSFLTSFFFIAIVILLVVLLRNPPTLIQSIVEFVNPEAKSIALPVSVPLLIVASAYFTSVRLAIIGVLGIALAFSLRMTRAYFHMIEHNQHKLRVTNSIEAFVAAVRTNERKDLVLSKLVESVTEFGDSGILDKTDKPTSLPSVIFEAMTKNVGKGD